MRPAATRTDSNRSQQVRQRRTTRTRTRVERAASNITSPQVTVRGTGLGSPILPRNSSRPRRVYTVAFQNTGRAYSLPAPTIRLGWRALSVLLVSGLIALLDLRLQFRPVQSGKTGHRRRDPGERQRHRSRAQTQRALDLHHRPLAARIELEKSFPELQQVSVLVGLPNQVSVSFSERTPVLAWEPRTRPIWIDAEGTIFNARGAAPKGLLTIKSTDTPAAQRGRSHPWRHPGRRAARPPPCRITPNRSTPSPC